MTSSSSVNQDALAKFQKINDWNNSYSLEDELSHSDSLHDSTASSFDLSLSNTSFSSLNSHQPAAVTSKYHGKSALRKSLKEKSPASVERGMRNQGWVGGHTPHGSQKPRRSYKLKNPSDEIYLKK
ncbi:unnamed protein product [Cylindrotheca closterium]|uniref:Uncharacterized protein n=1 Tax=Cylindrotheca closterium TaxID=2856 RepID=A0AAD2CYP3_9STRA|nr:unnamed protein product [Cylindrotheca closterium]